MRPDSPPRGLAPSNSQLGLSSETRPAFAAGVDTWSICWYLREDSPAERAMEALATVPGRRSRLLPDEIVNHRVGWFPASRLLFAEGHPAGPGALAHARDLPASAGRIAEALGDYGILPPGHRLAPIQNGRGDLLPVVGGSGFGGIRRLDSTVDLRFDAGAEGLAALTGVAALPISRIKTEIVRECGGRRVETVYLLGSAGRSVLGRWYDKGYESNTAFRGEWVRPEDQRRFVSGARPTLERVAEGTFVRDMFVRRFEPLWRASRGVIVAGMAELAHRVKDLVDTGEITPVMGEKLLGYLCADAYELDLLSRASGFRRRSACRELGLVLSDGTLDEVEVRLDEILERALDAEAWGCG